MKYAIDIETNGLINPTRIWVVVVKNLGTGEYHSFYDLTKKQQEHERFSKFIQRCTDEGHLLIGHNLLGYDWPVLCTLLEMDSSRILLHGLDTLIVSKCVDYSRDGHSIEDYGMEFGLPKGDFKDFSKYTPEMETYCVRDVDICEKIFLKYRKYLSNTDHAVSIDTEHRFQLVVNSLHDTGFAFNSSRANTILDKVTKELEGLDKDILEAFPPKLKLIREITPKETKYGTLSKTDFRWVSDGDLSEYNGGPFCRCSWESFNPSSHKQIVDVLHHSGWSPTDKTQSHIDAERDYNRLKRSRYLPRSGRPDEKEDLSTLELKISGLKKTGWKVNENNVSTLPEVDHYLLWKNKCRIKILLSEHSINESIINETATRKEKLRSNTTIKIQDFIKVDNSNEIMELISLSLSECVKNKTDVAKFVKSESNSWSIIVTPTEIFVDCSASFATDTWAGMRDLPVTRQDISRILAGRLLAKRILFESRRRTLTEWLGLVQPDGRIHGIFYSLGTWTHRCAHHNPNTANIPNEYDISGQKKLLGKELRALWCAPKNRLLVGCDAEGIQLRIFAHYINDPEFTKALVEGRKDDKTDPHSLNQRILGSVCKSRAAAKRFIYALLLGAGLGKLAEILGCTEFEAQEALDNLWGRYTGWAKLKTEVFPKDAKRGWFVGLDGRKVRIPSETDGGRRHLAMSGYLQNGEAVCMKLATLKFFYLLPEYDAKLVNFVHDEWQVECPNDVDICLKVGEMMADSLVSVGEDLKLNCPLAGSFYNDELKDHTIGTNWSVTH